MSVCHIKNCNLVISFSRRTIREKFDQLNEELRTGQRRVEVSLVQLSTFEESVMQFRRWIKETEAKIRQSSELQATLQAKKIQQQNVKVSLNHVR